MGVDHPVDDGPEDQQCHLVTIGLILDRLPMVTDRVMAQAHHLGDLATFPALADELEDLFLANGELTGHGESVGLPSGGEGSWR